MNDYDTIFIKVMNFQKSKNRGDLKALVGEIGLKNVNSLLMLGYIKSNLDVNFQTTKKFDERIQSIVPPSIFAQPFIFMSDVFYRHFLQI